MCGKMEAINQPQRAGRKKGREGKQRRCRQIKVYENYQLPLSVNLNIYHGRAFLNFACQGFQSGSSVITASAPDIHSGLESGTPSTEGEERGQKKVFGSSGMVHLARRGKSRCLL